MLAAKHSALQQSRNATDRLARPTPRPFPLFLEIVRRLAENEPQLARDALTGVGIYGAAPRGPERLRPVVATQGRTSLLDCGDDAGAPPVVIIPSLINPSSVLDLAPGNSLCEHLAHAGYRPLLVDWGLPDARHRDEGLADHISRYLLPLARQISAPFHLVGYCLGGTIALAASTALPLRSLTLVATPWHFDRYPARARDAAGMLLRDGEATIDSMGLMPIEMLQTLFWAIDERRTVEKYARLCTRADDTGFLAQFARVEDWTNSGAPLTAAVARDILDTLMQRNDLRALAADPMIAPSVRAHHFTATNDSITPDGTAPDHVAKTACPSGHVGMVVGRSARQGLWRQLTEWLSAQP